MPTQSILFEWCICVRIQKYAHRRHSCVKKTILEDEEIKNTTSLNENNTEKRTRMTRPRPDWL